MSGNTPTLDPAEFNAAFDKYTEAAFGPGFSYQSDSLLSDFGADAIDSLGVCALLDSLNTQFGRVHDRERAHYCAEVLRPPNRGDRLQVKVVEFRDRLRLLFEKEVRGAM